jgi:hypothetical protein
MGQNSIEGWNFTEAKMAQTNSLGGKNNKGSSEKKQYQFFDKKNQFSQSSST